MSSVSRGHPSPNERLREAIHEAGLTPERLAKKVHVNVQTVERWIRDGRVPFRTHQVAVSEVVGTRVSELWPGNERKGPRAEEENARLRRAIFDARMTPEQIAEKLNVDPKTVDRWITKSRVPYPKHRAAVSQLVGVPDSELWPGPRPRVELLAQEHSQTGQRSALAHGTTIQTNPRIRALMSWVDNTAPLKEHHIHPQLHAEQAQQPKPVEVANFVPQYRTMQEYDRLRASWRSR